MAVLEHIYTISELTRDIKILLEAKYPAIWVEGEISNYRKSPTGHIYFTLKDEFAQIGAIIFKSTYFSDSMELRDGMKVIAFGNISVYERRGTYQFIVTRIQEKGVGALQLAFEALKKKLFEEGLFDEKYKKPIPPFPQHIGVVTSPTGAAIRDILNVLDRRFSNLHIILNPVRVQGDEAAGEIVKAIEEFNELNNVDVIIVGRGGGSLEDLWPFNEEIVARAIFKSRIPIISAVGHEIDWTISDFVADFRAPTPSAAAELVVSRKEEILEKICNLREKLYHYIQSLVQNYKSRLRLATGSYVFREPINVVRQYQQLVDDYVNRLGLFTRHRLVLMKEKVKNLTKQLDSTSPKAVLNRGYSITTDIKEKKVITDTAKLEIGEKVDTTLKKGSFRSNVEKID